MSFRNAGHVAQYIALLAHTNPWCAQKYDLSFKRMELLLVLTKAFNTRAGMFYNDVQFTLDEVHIRDYPEARYSNIVEIPPLEYDPKEFFNAQDREFIADLLHVFAEYETPLLWKFIKWMTPGIYLQPAQYPRNCTRDDLNTIFSALEIRRTRTEAGGETVVLRDIYGTRDITPCVCCEMTKNTR